MSFRMDLTFYIVFSTFGIRLENFQKLFENIKTHTHTFSLSLSLYVMTGGKEKFCKIFSAHTQHTHTHTRTQMDVKQLASFSFLSTNTITSSSSSSRAEPSSGSEKLEIQVIKDSEIGVGGVWRCEDLGGMEQQWTSTRNSNSKKNVTRIFLSLFNNHPPSSASSSSARRSDRPFIAYTLCMCVCVLELCIHITHTHTHTLL